MSFPQLAASPSGSDQVFGSETYPKGRRPPERPIGSLATYAPLWQRIDRLLFLQGPGFEIVPDWRWQQEVSLQAANPRRHAMDRKAVERFVLFFERVSRQAMRTLPSIADRTLRIDAKRRPLEKGSE